jgi:hypothetical protein
MLWLRDILADLDHKPQKPRRISGLRGFCCQKAG